MSFVPVGSNFATKIFGQGEKKCGCEEQFPPPRVGCSALTNGMGPAVAPVM